MSLPLSHEVLTAMKTIGTLAEEASIKINPSFLEELENYARNIGVTERKDIEKNAVLTMIAYLGIVYTLARQEPQARAAEVRTVILTLGKHDDPNQTCKEATVSILKNRVRWMKLVPKQVADALSFQERV